ncbi:structure-specific endonuclease subunit SLX4-like isoform X2 [Ornithodoros turicata]|uniref:structure-specific endonuclease subunit SLX4-like isoform X2 n=1 Tax=Ornithodoros turicata TaxID=34597 RepID=UPI0031386EA4
MEQTRDGLGCVTCPICEKVVTTAVQSHVEKCLEKFKRAEPRVPHQEACICVVCRTDITNLDASHRTAHVNRCLDKECNEPVQEPVVSTPSRSTGASFELLDCPLCERGFKSSKACKAHIKQCSLQLNMSPKQVMDAIRLQQRYLQERLAAGLPLVHRRKPASDELVHRPTKRPRPAATIPKSKFQEEIQMAKALSASISVKDENGPREHRNQRLLGHTNNRGKKAKREAKPTPALLTTTAEERTRVVESKISRLLASTVADSSENCSLRRSWASLIKPSQRLRDLAEEGPSVLWTKATQSAAEKEQYYVPTLSDAVTHCKVEAGSKLRSLSQVAGHRISDAAAQFQHLDEQYANFLETQKPAEQETATQDHQDAVLSLIGGTLQPGTALSDVGYGFLTQEPSATPTEGSWESNSLRQLSCDLNNTVGAGRYADMRISVAGGKTIHAHRVIVYARCPSLQKDVVKSNGVNCLNWSEWSETCVRTFLSYLYGGTVDVKVQDKELTLQLRSLAFRYNLTSVCKFLEESLGDSLDKQAPLDSSLAEIITSLWDEEAVPRNSSSEKVEEAPTDEDDDVGEPFDDVYEFVASQRPQKPSGSSNIPEGGAVNQSQANSEGSSQPQSSQPQLTSMSHTNCEAFSARPQVLATSRMDHEESSLPHSSQPERSQPWIPTASPADYKGFSEHQHSQQTQPGPRAANQAELRGFAQHQPSELQKPQLQKPQLQKPQPQLPRVSQVDYKGFPGLPPSQSQHQLIAASQVDHEGFLQCKPSQHQLPQPQIPTPSRAAYGESTEPQPSQMPQPRHQIPTVSEAASSGSPEPQLSQLSQPQIPTARQVGYKGSPEPQPSQRSQPQLQIPTASQASYKRSPEPQPYQLSQPRISTASQAAYRGSPERQPYQLSQSRIPAASQAAYRGSPEPQPSQRSQPQLQIPTASQAGYKRSPEHQPYQLSQPQIPTASQAAYRRSPEPKPSQRSQPQLQIPTESHVGYKRSPEPQPYQLSQLQIPAASQAAYRRSPEPQPSQRSQPQLQIPTASQVGYRRSPTSEPSQPDHQLPTENQADYKRLPHQPESRHLSTSQTDFEGFPQSQQPQPEHLTSNEAEELQTSVNSSGGVSHSLPTRRLQLPYSKTSVPIVISPIHSEDEHIRVVPSKILSLPLPPMENGQLWYSPGSTQNAPSTVGSSNEHNASDAESADLFGSCDEVESNPEPQTTGDSDVEEQPMEVSGDNSSSPRSVRSAEDKRVSDRGDEDDIWNSVWEGFGDQGHCDIPELVLSPIGESKDSEVMSDTKEVPQEQFGAGEAAGRSVHSAMLDSHFFDEEACNQPYQSPLASRGRAPASAVTPLPDYDAMQTPELKGQLQKFGVRAFPRKKAVNILRHIYEETHPYVDQTPRRPASHSSSASQPNVSSRADSGEPSQSSGAGDNYPESRSSSSSGTDFGELETQADCEESDGHSEVDAHSKMKEFVRTNHQLYQRILSYEPIELRTLHADMKAAKIKVSLKVLMDFLDQQCITFRLPRTEKQRLKQQRRQKRFRQRVRAKIASSRA